MDSVTRMSGLFYNAHNFNQDLSSWNVTSVKNMSSMFRSVEIFNQDLSKWDITSVTNMDGMFSFAEFSTDNYDALLLSWSKQILKNNVRFSAGESKCTPDGLAQTLELH